MSLSASHQTIIRLINKLGENFDAPVKRWRDSFLPSLNLPEVMVFTLIKVEILRIIFITGKRLSYSKSIIC